jgi:hypothetical protein
MQDLKVIGDDIGSQIVQLAHLPLGDEKQDPSRSMTLLPVGRLEGRVVSEQPELFRNMTITIKTDPQSGEQCTGAATVKSDADGRFVIPKIAAGWVEVEAALADPRRPVRPRFIGRHQLEVSPGKTTRLDIPLEVVRQVAGVVRVKGTGEPVIGAKLTVRYGDAIQQSQTATTDSEGRYSAVGLPGQVNVQVFYTAHEDLIHAGEPWLARIPVPEGTTEFELPPVDLVKTKTISGRLLDHDGKPLANYRVNGLIGKSQIDWGETNDRGEFTLARVPEDARVERYTTSTDQSPLPKEAAIDAREPLVIRLK